MPDGGTIDFGKAMDLYYTYADGGSTTTDAISVESLLAVVKKFRKDQEELDAGMLDSLIRYIKGSGEGWGVWAERFDLPFIVFAETLRGDRRVSWEFWERLRRVFEPLRGK